MALIDVRRTAETARRSLLPTVLRRSEPATLRRRPPTLFAASQHHPIAPPREVTD